MVGISEDVYRDKTRGCWIGKSVGGTLGGPWERAFVEPEPFDLAFYRPVPRQPLPNDDLDIQLIWLHALETHGLFLTEHDLAREWLEHHVYPFDEYGVCTANLRRGLPPPVSGGYDNPFWDCMGSPIRSEIWATVVPGRPRVAARYAWQDAVLDHAGEGVFAEMFLAAVESQAYVESNRDALLETGLSVLPRDCTLAEVLLRTREWWDQEGDWREVRRRILSAYGHYNAQHQFQNLAFILLGWLAGDGDFGQSLLVAVNCGADTDCTGATLGAILGLVQGAAALPARWTAPVGEAVVAGWGVRGLQTPASVGELTERCWRLAREAERVFTPEQEAAFTRDLAQRTAWSPHAVQVPGLAWRYEGEPVVGPRDVCRITLRAQAKDVQVRAPLGWKVTREGGASEEIRVAVSPAEGRLEAVNWLHISSPDNPALGAVIPVLAARPWRCSGPMADPEGRPPDVDLGVLEMEDWPREGEELWTSGNALHLEGEPGTYYLSTGVTGVAAGKAVLALDTDDGCVVLWNGKEVFRGHDHGRYRPPRVRVPVDVQEGCNLVLVKLLSCRGSVRLYVRLEGEDRHELVHARFVLPH